MKINTPISYPPPVTAEGGYASRISFEKQLRRSVATCMLWENSAYESGESIADRIKSLIPKCRPEFVAACAFEARTVMNLRHVPLLLVREMARYPMHAKLVAKLLPDIIQRADELTEFVAIYWKEKREPLSNQVKKGLAKAFLKFNEYQLAKYNRDGSVKLRDVLFLCHAKAQTPEQDILFKKLINNELAIPNTWETRLSNGEDKKTVFEEIMADKQLGALATLRNLRNMSEAGVDKKTVAEYLSAVDVSRVLPFRYIAAARVVPQWEDIIEPVMLKSCNAAKKFKGKTLLLIDVSGSMEGLVSSRSDISRLAAACGVAILLRECCENVVISTFSEALTIVAPRRGFSLCDVIVNSQPHKGTYLNSAIDSLNKNQDKFNCDRLIVITDEQTVGKVPDSVAEKAYMINVAVDKNGVGYGAWNHIDGWSEKIIDYIHDFETTD